MFTDGSRLNSGVEGYAAVLHNDQSWVAIKNHMGSNQEAYDAECAALIRALEETQNARWRRSESPFLSTPRLPSGAWYRRTRDQPEIPYPG